MILPVRQFFAYLEVGENGGSTFDMPFIALDAVSALARQWRPAVDAQGQRPQRNLSGVPRSLSAPPKAGENRAMTATAEHLFEGGTPAVTIRVCPRGHIQGTACRSGGARE